MINKDITNINSPVRQIKAKVELYDSSTLLQTYTYTDSLQAITITRVPDESKFFGFGVCQKVNIKIRDVDRSIDITTANSFKVYFAAGNDEYINNFPTFYVTEVHRDETTNALSITAYDKLYFASEHTVSEINLTSYYVHEFIEAIATLLGLTVVSDITDTDFYKDGANYEGTENLREALDDATEAVQAIYYISGDSLVLKRLTKGAAVALTIGKACYMALDNKGGRRLVEVVHATELGDNVSASLGLTGTIQYVRNNPFWDMLSNPSEQVERALATVGGLTIDQFNLTWRGNHLLEIGDKVEIITKDDEVITTFILNDTIEYNGSLTEKTSWNYAENEAETASNPSSLGEALSQTYARVDKQKKEIELVASKSDSNTSSISALKQTTDSISSSVVKSTNDISELQKQVDAQMTPEKVTLQIKEELNNGVEKVRTGKGFTFDDTGLTVEDLSDQNNKIKTTISNNGMTVYNGNKEVLTANDEGVKAVDLHAETFLIIGKNSRFEDSKDKKRTCCFWIGG